ncbi:MAG: hypothetical protein AABX03_00075, partial [Nanoarchaeota archaeon]
KGMNHVEFIVSFVIFVSFVLVLFVIFNPFKKPTNTGLADSVFLNLEENISTILSSVSINVNTSSIIIPTPPCLEINYLADMDCGNGKNLVVKNISGNITPSSLDNPIAPTNFQFSYVPGNTFYTFYCSDELKQSQNNLNGCQRLNEQNGDYQLGIIRDRKLWSEKRISAFKQQYNSNYDGVKKEIISQGNDFGFIITDINNNVEINATSKRPSRGNIFAKTLPIDIVDENATIKKRVIIVMSW